MSGQITDRRTFLILASISCGIILIILFGALAIIRSIKSPPERAKANITVEAGGDASGFGGDLKVRVEQPRMGEAGDRPSVAGILECRGGTEMRIDGSVGSRFKCENATARFQVEVIKITPATITFQITREAK